MLTAALAVAAGAAGPLLMLLSARRRQRAAARQQTRPPVNHPSHRQYGPGLPTDGWLTSGEASALLLLEQVTWDGIEQDAAAGQPGELHVWTELSAQFEQRGRAKR